MSIKYINEGTLLKALCYIAQNLSGIFQGSLFLGHTIVCAISGWQRWDVNAMYRSLCTHAGTSLLHACLGYTVSTSRQMV